MPRRLEVVLEGCVLVAAAATIPLIVAAEVHGTTPVLDAADWLLWSVFVAEYVVMLARSSDRSAYVRAHWLSATVIVVSFPLLPTLLASTRLARLAQLPRILRLFAVTVRALGAIRVIFGRRALTLMTTVTALLIVAGAALLTVLEPATVGKNYWSGIWWAVVTTSTVGYGDIVPASPAGRIAAVVLMLAGIGFVSTLSAAIAAYFIEQDEGVQLAHLNERLDRVERLLEAIRESLTSRGR